MNKIIENKEELATKEYLKKIEKTFNISLDEYYKSFLLKYNGGY
jgi:hypothetical protein